MNSAPVRTDVPARGYPWHWSVLSWIPGRVADSHAKDVYRREADSAQRATSVVKVVRIARKRIARKYARIKFSMSFQAHE